MMKNFNSLLIFKQKRTIIMVHNESKLVQKENVLSSITIHNLDEDLEKMIKKKAEKEHLSLNKTIKLLLKKSLGLENNTVNHKNDFIDIFKSWSNEDLINFKQKTKDLDEINPEDWK